MDGSRCLINQQSRYITHKNRFGGVGGQAIHSQLESDWAAARRAAGRRTIYYRDARLGGSGSGGGSGGGSVAKWVDYAESPRRAPGPACDRV